MTTLEVAKYLGISRTTLRAWETKLGLDIARDSRGHRNYSPEDVQRLLEYQQGDLWQTRKEWLEEALARQGDLLERLEKLQASKSLVQGILKQILAQVLEAQGALQAIERTPERILYRTPEGINHEISLVCQKEAQKLMDTIVSLLTHRVEKT